MRSSQVLLLSIVIAGLTGVALLYGMGHSPWLHVLFLASCATLIAVGVHLSVLGLKHQTTIAIEEAEHECLTSVTPDSPCLSDIAGDARPVRATTRANEP